MRKLYAIAIMLAACSSKGTGTGDDDGTTPEPDPKGWTITVDMSGTDRFVQPADSTTWTVNGVATGTGGIASVTVDDAMVDLASDGAFSTSVPVMPGLTRVHVLATDTDGHTRKGDRALMTARYLENGQYNTGAANLVLTSAVLSAMNDSVQSYATGVDVAAEILARDVLSQDDRCITWPVQATQGTVTATLTNDQGNLWLRIRVPNLYVYFEGQCQGLLSQIPIAGQMKGTIDVWTQLTAKPGDGCLHAFDHSQPQTQISGWQFDVWGTSGPLQSWIVDLFSGGKSDEARAQLTSEVGTKANTLLTQKLSNVTVFEKSSQLDLFGRPLGLDLCVSNIVKTGTTLRASVAARASGMGDKPAPGAPLIDGAAVPSVANELVLDSNVIGQLLFAAWQDGGLAKAGPAIDAGILQILMPGLAKEFPDATTADVWIDADLPPLVRATPSGPGDVAVELGDLMIDVSIDGKRILRFGIQLTLALDLMPMNGALVPKVVDTKAEVSLLDERYDGVDAALEQAVQSQIGSAASQLLGAGTSIALPQLPGLGAPTDVVPDAGGRFLHIKL
jgi:hypothetical protein